MRKYVMSRMGLAGILFLGFAFRGYVIMSTFI